MLNLSSLKNLKNIFIIICSFWFFIIAVNCVIYYFHVKAHVYSRALEEARESFEKDVILREWISTLGGVYVPVSNYIKPNPYLKIPRRDVTTEKGEKLTLLNPAYVTRLLHEFENKKNDDIISHITSLDPINPKNQPNRWEKRALKSFEAGKTEYKQLADKNGKTVFRYMAPLKVKEVCLKCHGEKGYKIGDRYYEVGEIRGGISVTLNFSPYQAVLVRETKQFIISSAVLGIFGFLGLFVSYRIIRKQRRETENERDKYLALFENSPLGIMQYDKEGNILECNSVFADLMGSSEEKITQLNLLELNNEKISKAYNDSIIKGFGVAEGWYTSVTGNKTVYARASFKGIEDENGEVVSGIAVVEDNTESYYREKDLERLATIVKDSINEIYIYDADTLEFIDANRSALENIGYSLDELRRMTPLDINLNSTKEDFEQIINPLKTGEKDKVIFNTYHCRKDGSKYPVEIYLQWMELEKPVFVSFAYDITRRKQTEEKFENIFNSVNDAIRIVDLDGNILSTNRKGAEYYGYSTEELKNMNIEDIRTKEGTDKIKENIDAIRQKGSMIFETEHKRKDGTTFPVEINSTLIEYEGKSAILNVIRDISERKRAEKEKDELTRQVIQSQKLEAVGQLAGGIAHDFNNFLAGMMAYIDLLKRSRNLEQHEKEYLSQMMQLAERSAKLVENMLAFSRKQVSMPQIIDVNRQLSISEKLYRKMIKENIQLMVEYYSHPIYIKIDPVQLDQIILNLVSNARDAIEDNGRIDIKVSTGSSEDILEHNSIVKPNADKYCLLTVSDNGAGIDEEKLYKIFEPFFTTKSAGTGTGLGLATIYGIVKQNNGYIFCESKKGRGTTFYIYFPVSDEKPSEKQLIGKETKPDEKVSYTEKKVLLCEDDESVRNVLSKMLGAAGFNIIEAADGEEGLRKFEENKDDIFCVVSDYVIPFKNGIELYEDIMSISPDMGFILVSGYSHDADKIAELNENRNFSFLNKPLKPELLKRTIMDIAKHGND
ncbi:PAS domain S-box protein [Flexistipes sp.]|uniref:PAS domain S-box protein n=1 Tax=Flexistipes sp. TaxID=3088135 RepID=UPI002E1F4131|nr:PAS domain S-box protein [Flexistipes sp.]